MEGSPFIVDTGPLVAYLTSEDRYHRWAAEWLDRLPQPLMTCEAVLSEACFLVARLKGGIKQVLDLVATGSVRVELRVADEVGPLSRLCAKYGDVPISLADACLLRLAELNPGSTVVTVDSDFWLYRQHRDRAIPLIIPPDVKSPRRGAKRRNARR